MAIDRWWHRGLGLLLALGISGFPRCVLADEAISRKSQGARTVNLTLVCQADQALGLESLIREWLGTQADQFSSTRQSVLTSQEILAAPSAASASAPPQALRIWVVLRHSGLAKIYFADPSGQRFLMREVPLGEELDELGRERVAQVVATSARAFLEQQASSDHQDLVEALAAEPSAPVVAEAPAEASPKLKPNPPLATGPSADSAGLKNASTPLPIPAESVLRLRLGANYSTVLAGPEGVVHGPGILVKLNGRGDSSWALQGNAGYSIPREVDGEHLTLSLQGWVLGVSLGLDARQKHSLGWGIAGGAALDRVQVDPSARPGGGITTFYSGVDWRGSAQLSLRGIFRSGRIEVALVGMAKVPLVNAHYDVNLDGQRRVELSSWRIQPGLTLEIWKR